MGSVWLGRGRNLTVAEPPRTRTGFLIHRRARAYGTMPGVSHPVYLVRHGQSRWNVQRRTQGQTSHPPLTALGREQARAAGEVIAADVRERGLVVDGIISSDLVRAQQSAQILARRFDVAVREDARLREQHLGRLQGRSYEETWAAADQVDWSDPRVAIGGGESLQDVYDRMAQVLRELDRARVLVLVSHGDAIRAALAYLRGSAPHEAEWVEVPNGAVARIEANLSWLGQ